MQQAVALAMPVSFLSVSLLAPLAAQATHLVGPRGYPQIAAAILAASPGDIVVVQPGQYEMFTLTKGLTIRATAQASGIAVRPRPVRPEPARAE